jgi:beta-lactamase class A
MDPIQRIDKRVTRLVEPYADSAFVSVYVQDLSSGREYERDSDRVFHAASTMKVPVLLELFRRVEAGEFGLDDSLLVDSRFRSLADSSVYQLDRRTDSDQDLYELHGLRVAIRDLAHRMIHRSSNLATNLLIERVRADSVQATMERLGVRTMKVLRGVEDLQAYRKGLNNTVTARDLGTLLAAMAQGKAVSASADSQMVQILLDQEFNEMIPAGLPEGARAAHKTGQITGIHHDAGIVYPAEGGPYVIVILTEGFLRDTESARIGSEISHIVYGVLRG